jgi:hypothetical protein
MFSVWASGITKAQIIYHDEPNTLHTNSYNIDIDNDGYEEYYIGVDNLNFTCYSMPANFSGNCYGGGSSLIYFNLNQPVSSSTNWDCDEEGVIIDTENSYKYIGIKFSTSGQVYYGWIRLKTQNASFIIDSWAYNSSPGESINAGQENSVGIDENTADALLAVYPNPASDFITVEQKLFEANATYNLVLNDAQGKTVLQSKTRNNTPVDISSLSKGFYALILTNADKQVTTQIIIE